MVAATHLSAFRMTGDAAASGVLAVGRNVWRIERAERAAVLVDAAPYYGALREAMRRARHTIHIVGWDIDSRTRLVGESGKAEDGLPEAFGAFLSALVARNPALSIKLLLWDYSVLYSLERELMPVVSLQWNTPRQVELCLDDVLPLGSAHHQKIVVIDDAVAFSGGLDITVRRWDTSAHRLDEPHRVDPRGAPYPPFHDVQMMVDGRAAQAMAELVRSRWACAACERLPPVRAVGDPWPAHVAPDFRRVAVGIARTHPLADGGTEIREVEALFEDMIAAADRSLYIENQFLTSPRLAQALIARLTARPELEAVIIGPRTHHTWLEHQAMLAGRIRFTRAVRASAGGERVRILHPCIVCNGTRTDVMVHSKVMIVDDRLLRVGSANLCNRSMGVDTECDLVIEAWTPGERRAVARLRDRLLGEHCGATADEVAALVASTGSLIAAIDALPVREHRLCPIDDGALPDEDYPPRLEMVADPERPIAAPEFLRDIVGEHTPPRHLSRLAKTGLGALALFLLVLAWRYTPLSALARPEELRDALAATEGPWAPALVAAVFVLAGLVAFPVTVLIAGTAAAFGTWPGFAYAAGGALASALVTYGLGRSLGTEALRSIAGPRINRIRRAISRKGIPTITAIRLVPVAPFTLVNLVAGAMRIPLPEYLIGTALGLTPGLLLLSALGERLFLILRDPSLSDVAVFLALVVCWTGLSFALQALVSKVRGARQ